MSPARVRILSLGRIQPIRARFFGTGAKRLGDAAVATMLRSTVAFGDDMLGGFLRKQRRRRA